MAAQPTRTGPRPLDHAPGDETPARAGSTDRAAAGAGRAGLSRFGLLPGAGSAARHYVATASAVGLGVAFLAATLMIGSSLRASVGTPPAGAAMLTNLLLVFVVVALAVCAIVIANTFTIVLAQRARTLALLRCVGASRGQVFASVLLEAVAVGLAASIGGVALAAAGTFALVAGVRGAPDAMLSTWAAGPVELGVPVVVGTGLCVLASLLPARRATKVAPLAALRPDLPGSERRRGAGVVRTALGILVAAAGFAALVVGAVRHRLELGVAGGVVSFAGVLLLAVVVVGPALRLCGVLAGRVAGVPGALAADNAARNPRRAAATCSALLIGVTLVVMMAVGAETGRAVARTQIDAHFPVDVAVSARDALPEATVTRLRATPGVTGAAAQAAGTVELTAGARREKVAASGLDVDAARRIARPGVDLPPVGPGAVVVDRAAASRWGVAEGGTVRIGGRGFTAHLADVSPAVMLSAADLRAVATGTPHVTGVWLGLADPDHPQAVVEAIGRVVAPLPDVEVAGVAAMRAEFDRILDTVLLAVVALLGVAVVIALVGVGNTLGLSVLERTRESALLRALGLTRRQLRATLALEAALLALVGVVGGTALGVLYGWAGVHALLGAYADAVALQVPVGRLALAGLVAIVAALLASVLPARRAARIAPAAALAGGE